MKLQKIKQTVTLYHQKNVNTIIKIDSIIKKHPLITSVAITTIKTAAADLMVQRYIEGNSYKNINWARNSVFICFGFIYLGCFQYWLYNHIYFFMFPGITIKSTIQKVAFDQFIKHPFIYFPVFYTLKECINEKNININITKNALNKYKINMKQDCIALWSFAMPINTIVFGFIPKHYRLPCIAITSFIWTGILSFYRGQFNN